MFYSLLRVLFFFFVSGVWAFGGLGGSGLGFWVQGSRSLGFRGVLGEMWVFSDPNSADLKGPV